MIYGKIIVIAITLGGTAYSLANLIMLIKCILAQRVPATIIGYRGSGIHFGVHTFIYRVFAAPGIVLQLERNVKPLMSMLPFYSIDNYVGRDVMVPFDTKNKKLMPHEPILVVKLVLSLIVVALGIVMLVVLSKLKS